MVKLLKLNGSLYINFVNIYANKRKKKVDREVKLTPIDDVVYLMLWVS